MTQTPPKNHAGPPRRDIAPEVPETSFAERVRTLLEAHRVGTLSSHSAKFSGFPFGSVMPYALDAAGNPLLLISAMAMHTQNLRQNSRASLLVAQDSVGRDPLGAARVTLLGTAERLNEDSEVRERYLAWHENASYWVDFKDFSFFRLQVEEVYYVGGFGVMGWVPGQEFAASLPDPLAPFATGILDHMNEDHRDALVLLARHQGQVPGGEEAKMTSVDRLGFRVRVRSGERWQSRRIAFAGSVGTPDGARQELIRLVHEARKQEPSS
ncbi:MAG: DUF2470 domain-containing protein [Deltaproteobacteria bacterium]|nr:DUF2470 domain-containing protein [Deltaproteobacteria bacterium]